MLTDQEESEMHSKETNYDNGYARFQNFENKTRLSNNEQNFALSLCARKTYYITKDNQCQNFVFDIDELDPWQEYITMYTYVHESNPRKRKIKMNTGGLLSEAHIRSYIFDSVFVPVSLSFNV